MNLAEQLNESASEIPATLQVASEASNIIHLPETSEPLPTPVAYSGRTNFVDHIGSPLNEW